MTRTGHPVNLYLSDETLRKLDELIAYWGDKKMSKSKAIQRLIEEDPEYQKWLKRKEEK